MAVFYRLMLLLVVALLAGCGKPSETVSANSMRIAEPTPEQKFAATLKEAERGDAVAQRDLGMMYENGDGVAKDDTQAVVWHRKAAEQGDAKAQVNLGVHYAYGEGVPEDAVQAVAWFRKASEQGDARAQRALGAMYRIGKGVDKDAAQAVEWMRKAAEQGDVKAQLFLGNAYRDGEGILKNAALAAEWYRKAADQGNADAQFNLGSIYSVGEDVPKDAEQAAKWYRKAAEQGDAKAQNMLGWIYGRGDGVPKDAAVSVEWYRRAAEQGNPTGQYNLGVNYARGEGIAADQVLAYAWLNLAAAGGDGDAQKARAVIERNMSSAQQREAQALSSKWKAGQGIGREGAAATASTGNSSTLSKQSTGTGFFVARDGLAITNYHVIAGCTEVRIDGRDGIARVITDDKVNDLALLFIPGNIAATASIAKEPQKLRQGGEIVVFGFPLNSTLSSSGNLTPGVVSALTGLGNNTNQMQITAPIQPGSSGSPVLNKKGEVVGVVSMKLSDSKMVKVTGSVGQNVNFAVSGLTLKTFLDTHKVDYSYGGMISFDKSAADLADEARKWTLIVECWK